MFMTRTVFFVLLTSIAFQPFVQAEGLSLLDTSRELMKGNSYYLSITTLEPLLLQKEKSDDQQEAYLIADKICDSFVNDYDHLLIREFESIYGVSSGKDMEWEKIKKLNRLGAGITYAHMAGSYDYQYAFLKTLLKRYPDSRYAPAAKFYMIRPGYNEIKDVERELRELNSYLKKCPDLKESDLARLKIARINDNLWQILSADYGREQFTSGDRDKDAKRALRCRLKALKLYQTVLNNKKIGSKDLGEVRERYGQLKELKRTNRYWILND